MIRKVLSVLAVGVAVLAVGSPAHAAFPGKDGRIAFTTGLFGVSSVKPDGTDLQELASTGRSAAWSPDGRVIAIDTLRPDSFPPGPPVRLRAIGPKPAWEPSGLDMAFERVSGGIFPFEPRGNYEIFVG